MGGVCHAVMQMDSQLLQSGERRRKREDDYYLAAKSFLSHAIWYHGILTERIASLRTKQAFISPVWHQPEQHWLACIMSDILCTSVGSVFYIPSISHRLVRRWRLSSYQEFGGRPSPQILESCLPCVAVYRSELWLSRIYQFIRNKILKVKNFNSLNRPLLRRPPPSYTIRIFPKNRQYCRHFLYVSSQNASLCSVCKKIIHGPRKNPYPPRPLYLKVNFAFRSARALPLSHRRKTTASLFVVTAAAALTTLLMT